MPTSQPNPKVDAVIAKEDKWRDAFTKLRDIALSCPLEEELKWGCPCYSHEGRNIFLIHGFKEYCALLFHKGALLSDPDNLLVQQTKNVQSARQIRFTSAQEITARKKVLRGYMLRALELEKSGAKVEYKATEDFEVVPELKARFRSTPSFKAAFEALTPGRQRGYLLHFASAKQAATREARIEKCAPAIYAGKGLQDR